MMVKTKERFEVTTVAGFRDVCVCVCVCVYLCFLILPCEMLV